MRKNLKQILLLAQIYFLDFHRLSLRVLISPIPANFRAHFAILAVNEPDEGRGGLNEIRRWNSAETSESSLA